MSVVAGRWQRLEGLALLAVAALAYGRTGQGWLVFAVLFLAPDLSFFGYLAGPRIGGLIYNLAHSLIGPLMLAGVGLVMDNSLVTGVALIWLAHIGLDRMLGYGLKSSEAFGITHLGTIGRARKTRPS
ncbi:DUF4260 domain-containing protein [Brevundimonas sp.]|uniref:DUF4260 domain-containing protein n=1 Tax=Brevundimonas sp. TaxID=1871086 RepID=UPI001AC391A1|nr:DUF4260 domain-containing protein [Brevundimonas sp.]MBN9465812.1 DUF4260 domain-containing protein [Brevundimonas sp.]